MADPWIPATTAQNLADRKRDFHDHKLFSAADNYACNFLFDRGTPASSAYSANTIFGADHGNWLFSSLKFPSLLLNLLG